MIMLVFSILVATFSLFLSFLLYRARPENFLNRSLAAGFAFFGSWIAFSYSHLLLVDPSPRYVTWMYRVCYTLIVMATGFFFLFALGFLRGGHPGRKTLRALSIIITFLALLNLTGLTLREASYGHGVYRQQNGPLYVVFVLTEAILGGGALICLYLKRRRSMGTDRSRATYILAGFGIYIPLAILLALVLPGFMERDVTTQYAYLLAVVPLGVTAYALLRHRLLDVRLAVRYTFTYLVALLVFGLPLLAFYLAFSYLWRYDPRVYAALSACILALAVALTPAALRRAGNLASRLFFSGLYDEVELLHQASMAIMRGEDVQRGIAEATALVCERLGLGELVALVPDAVTEGRGTWLMGARRERGGVVAYVEKEWEDSPLHGLREETLLLEDRGIMPSDAMDEEARREMGARGLVAAVPLRGPGGPQGVLLVGEKPNRLPLDPMDLEFLEDFAKRIGLFVENHLLSFRLMARVEELTRARDLLEESDRFKTEIIVLTSHEFRTPLTVLKGFINLMADRSRDIGERQWKELLGYTQQACRRLERLVDEFHTVSLLRGGRIARSASPCSLREVFGEAINGLEGRGEGRVGVELPEGDLEVVTDRRLLLLILSHLLENAIRYNEPGSPVLLRGEKGGEGVSITIRDHGEGIPVEVVDRLFEPFTRLEEIDKHRAGAGLGLYIVRLACDLLGIRVEVESRPGEGSTFRLHLPGAASQGKDR